MVLVTSTTLKDSRKRIWGSIRDYWQAAPALPGKLWVHSFPERMAGRETTGCK
jgi:hypothetical protein